MADALQGCALLWRDAAAHCAHLKRRQSRNICGKHAWAGVDGREKLETLSHGRQAEMACLPWLSCPSVHSAVFCTCYHAGFPVCSHCRRSECVPNSCRLASDPACNARHQSLIVSRLLSKPNSRVGSLLIPLSVALSCHGTCASAGVAGPGAVGGGVLRSARYVALHLR